jgi:sigma-B regulation protein RsbU (phosphoserine phosphatase)
MNVHLSTRLIVRVGIPGALLFLAVMWLAAQRSYRRVLEQTERTTRVVARQYAARLNTVLSRAEKIPEMIALTVESGKYATPPDLEKYLRDALRRSPESYGSCIAFEAHTFDPAREFYAPYYYWMDGEPQFVQLGNPEYNYFKWDWYKLPKAAGRALWSEPYFDEGGGNTIMTTYSVPFYKAGRFWGIATVDIAMSQLMSHVGAVEGGRSSYSFIISKQGRFLTHPDKSQIMRGMIQQVNPGLGRLMISGIDGFLRTREPATQRASLIAFAPVANGEFSIAIVYPESEVMSVAMRLHSELLMLTLAGLAAMLIALVFIARSISRPISQLSQAAQQVAAGEFAVKLDTRAPVAEVRNLTHAFNKMAHDLQLRMQELRYTTTVKERLEGELSAARSIQMSLLPKTFPAFPERSDVAVHAIVRPAREVGGDFYDFYFIDPDHLCAVIADVSGKGIPAALYMAVTKTLIKANASPELSPAEIMARVNRELCEKRDTGMFVTLLLAILNTATGELKLCNAGHHPPLLIDATGAVTPVSGQSPALGLLPEAAFEICTVRLRAGDTLFFFTDGVTEAVNEGREFFSATRLHEMLRGTQAQRVEEMTRRVVQEVSSFCAARDQSDDISVLALRWTGADPEEPQTHERQPHETSGAVLV